MDAGQIVLVDFPEDGNPGKKKYAICVDPTEGSFFLISSQPRRRIPASVRVTPDELPFLDTESFVNAGEVYEFNVAALDSLIGNDEAADLGVLPEYLKERICKEIKARGHTLTPRQQAQILSQLSPVV